MQKVWREAMKKVDKSSVFFHELVQKEELQRLQDKFCLVNDIFAYCLDDEGKRITKISGEPEKAEYLQEHVEESAINKILNKADLRDMEEPAVEECGLPDVKMAAVSVRIREWTAIRWIVFGWMSDGNGREAEGLSESEWADLSVEIFLRKLDLLKDFSVSLLQNKYNRLAAQEESRNAEELMGRRLKSSEAFVQAVQLLDSDEPVDVVMSSLVKRMGEYLNVSMAEILKVHADGRNMDVCAEWCNDGVMSPFDKLGPIPAFEYLDEDKPFLQSFNQKESQIPFKAIASFPVLKQKNTGTIFLQLIYLDQDHIWNTEEVKFITEMVKVLQRILAKRIQKNSIAGSYEVLESILDNVGCGIYVQDVSNGQALFANSRLKETFCAELEEGSFDHLIDQGRCRKKGSASCEICHGKRERWYDLFSTEISWVDGRKVRLSSFYDVTDKKSYQKRIEQQAYTDFLTGLYNRMCCERDLEWHIEEARKKNACGCLLYLDLDDFKHINDGLGHQYGDELLKSISHSLQRIDGIQNTCYRMGGDEFVVIVPTDCFGQYERIVEDIRLIFSKPWYLKEADYYCTMSMGVVTFPECGESVTELIKKADIAMYEAKKGGKNRLARYSDTFDAVSGRRLDMEKNMRDATAAGYKEFQVYFQPIIDVQKGGMKCIGAEALVRWNSVNLGFIPPSEFIPLAEYLGLINPIGNYVLLEACRSCKYWNDFGYPDYKVSVNLSVVQLLQPDIVDSVGATIRETGIDPANLTLEVTESLAINDMERMKEILCSIKCLGVMIALDDFGTGYSSLNHIREIPFDVIKVDQSFVKDLADDAYSQSFIKMVAELAETIGVCICVEGIETTEQYKVIQKMKKVRFIQGFYFDRPMGKAEFEKKYLPGLAKGSKTV